MSSDASSKYDLLFFSFVKPSTDIDADIHAHILISMNKRVHTLNKKDLEATGA